VCAPSARVSDCCCQSVWPEISATSAAISRKVQVGLCPASIRHQRGEVFREGPEPWAENGTDSYCCYAALCTGRAEAIMAHRCRRHATDQYGQCVINGSSGASIHANGVRRCHSSTQTLLSDGAVGIVEDHTVKTGVGGSAVKKGLSRSPLNYYRRLYTSCNSGLRPVPSTQKLTHVSWVCDLPGRVWPIEKRRWSVLMVTCATRLVTTPTACSP